ncbi:hypothetical protein JCM8097_001882, partial [Rhodosporidiobolus ruineniae]
VFTFPLWSPNFVRIVHPSFSRLSIIASCAILGEYAVAAPFGSLADRRGPGAVSLVAAVLFAIGFGTLSWRYNVGVSKHGRGELAWSEEWVILAAAYFLVGCGTAASYFSAVIACTKSAPARHSGLAIAIPCAVFGLSPLFLSALASFFTSSSQYGHSGELEAGRYLLSLAVLLGLVNLVGAFAIKALPWEDNLEKALVETIEPEDSERFSSAVGDSAFAISSEAGTPGTATPNERTALLPTSRPAPTKEVDHSLRAFITTTSFWLLGGIVFLSTGPAEMYMASVSSILDSLLPPTVLASPAGALSLRKNHVALLSVSNTVLRLAVGAASDWIAAPPASRTSSGGETRALSSWRRNIRLWMVGAACLLLASAYGWGATGLRKPAGLWVVTLATGIGYGTVFTLTPALVRARWGTESFGRNWGLLTWFSALGALLFTPLFGLFRDLAASSDGTCTGPRCYRPIFVLSAASAATAVVFVAVLGRRWGRR